MFEKEKKIIFVVFSKLFYTLLLATWHLQNNKKKHYVKYARIRVFSDLYFPVQGHNLLFCSYTGKWGQEKTGILKYFAQCNTNGFFPMYCFSLNRFSKQTTWFSSVVDSPLHLSSAFTRIWILLFGRDNIYLRFQGRHQLLSILGRIFMV